MNACRTILKFFYDLEFEIFFFFLFLSSLLLPPLVGHWASGDLVSPWEVNLGQSQRGFGKAPTRSPAIAKHEDRLKEEKEENKIKYNILI